MKGPYTIEVAVPEIVKPNYTVTALGNTDNDKTDLVFDKSPFNLTELDPITRYSVLVTGSSGKKAMADATTCSAGINSSFCI